MRRIEIKGIEGLDAAASEFAGLLEESGARVVAFYGEMGAGKTTFIRRLASVLGADAEEVNSPSFSIVNEYGGKEGPIHHFDLYRLEDEVEAVDLGLDELIYSGDLCLLEWPERIEGLLGDDVLRVEIVDEGGGSRAILPKSRFDNIC